MGSMDQKLIRLKGKSEVGYFETVIRYVGGLLSAFAMTNDTILLQRAEELVDLLDPVFNTTSGLAAFSVNPATYVISPFSATKIDARAVVRARQIKLYLSQKSHPFSWNILTWRKSQGRGNTTTEYVVISSQKLD